MSELETTALWQAFSARASDEQRAMVRQRVAQAADRLDLVRDTFPTYTLHNRTHGLNLVRLMGDLLDAELVKLDPLEAALLILAAYFHDIGMVFTPDERADIAKEAKFAQFLEQHAQARLDLAQGGMSDDLTEWYCRWIHPDRVFVYLRSLPKDALLWDGQSLSERLGQLCRSHGYDVAELRDDKRFPVDYLGRADLAFCAIVLRLADILDFDNSRSPDEVYRYLALARRSSRRTQASDVEWRKHLASGGFRFVRDAASGNCTLKIIARPDAPAVEHDVRQFLEVIEEELAKCTRLLRQCAPRWRDVRLPGIVDVADIQSEGYRYGEHRFTLDQDRILELLMGEGLYDDPFVCVREVLQNAIDTSRHREHHEHSRGQGAFAAGPIEVSSWLDADSCRWIRFDDYGMGMTQALIEKFFLRVGRSYYQSAEFRTQAIDYAKGGAPAFVPISRFGIGILSCFILGDQVEVSTRPVPDSQGRSQAVRLSLSGLHAFYVMQCEADEHYDPKPMPADRGSPDQGYRDPLDFGTSIAIRVNPQSERSQIDLREILERYVACAPVPVLFEGERVGGDPELLIDKPWCDAPIEVELTAEETAQLEHVLQQKLDRRPKVRMLPLDLSRHSPRAELRGQALLGYVDIDPEVKDAHRRRGGRIHVELGLKLSTVKGTAALRLEASFEDQEQREQAERDVREVEEHRQPRFDRGRLEDAHDRLRNARRRANIDLDRTLAALAARLVATGVLRAPKGHLWLAHNGIAVPTSGSKNRTSWGGHFIPLGADETINDVWTRARVQLTDGLRPDVSVSRDELRGLSWETYSALQLAFRRAAMAHGDLRPRTYWGGFDSVVTDRRDFLLGHLVRDPLLAGAGGWIDEAILEADGTPCRLEDLRQRAEENPNLRITSPLGVDTVLSEEPYRSVDIVAVCTGVLIQMGLDCELRLKDYGSALVVRSGARPQVARGQMLFPPMCFVPYRDSDLLRKGNLPMNQSHPFAQWLVERTPEIAEQFPGIFRALRAGLCKSIGYGGKTDWEEHLVKLNATLDRLWELSVQLRPAKRFRLEMTDFAPSYGTTWS